MHSRFLVGIIMLMVFSSNACSTQTVQLNKPHHTANGFTNPQETEQTGFLDLLKWRWDRLFKNIPAADTYDFPVVTAETNFLHHNSTIPSITWIGHATLLVQMGGVNIITDPQFSRRASPLQWLGPQRVVPPGIALQDLPRIHYVVISHDHYDSLDVDSIKALFQRPEGQQITFIVPLRLKAWFEDLGITRVVELDWWESYTHDSLTFTAAPSQHWSKRTPFSRNKTLWASWIIKAAHFNFYFCGDSGYYAPMFKEIGAKLGPFDAAAIPIGAYEPRWFMRSKHMNPEEAVKVHLDLNAKQSVAIHWGTFILTDEPLTEPPQKLRQALQQYNIPQTQFRVLRHGDTIRF